VPSKRALIEAVGLTSGGAIGRLNVRAPVKAAGMRRPKRSRKAGPSRPLDNRAAIDPIAMVDLRVQDAAGITADEAACILPTQE